MNLAWSIIC